MSHICKKCHPECRYCGRSTKFNLYNGYCFYCYEIISLGIAIHGILRKLNQENPEKYNEIFEKIDEFKRLKD
jgi:hypothetical protein